MTAGYPEGLLNHPRQIDIQTIGNTVVPQLESLTIVRIILNDQ